ncbi:hypothetical protein Plhal703r1_c08g0042581 [Plasmopara halstedii]
MVCVVSCRFLRLSCSEDDHPLFRRNYARSNRERGIKLLRCFPHCCPEHVERCYCGTSIHFEVTFAAAPSPEISNALFVCARFEPSKVVPLWPSLISDASDDNVTQVNERKLQPGEIVVLPADILATAKSKSDHMVWIRADKQNETKLKSLPQNVVLYVLNNHRFPKWQYGYDSSVTRTQRDMTHHLVVYVFQLIESKSDCKVIKASVLARHESPGFSLFSHRRSGNSSRVMESDHHAVDLIASTTLTNPEVGASAMPSNFMKFNLVKPSIPRISDLDSKNVSKVAIQASFNFPQTAPAFIESDTNFWAFDLRFHQTKMAEKMKHLLILWRFLSHVTLYDTGITSEFLYAQSRSHWLQAARALRSSPEARKFHLKAVMDSFLQSLCRTQIHAPNQNTTYEQVVVQVVLNLSLCALSSQSLYSTLLAAFTASSTGMDKRDIHEIFITLVLDIYDVLSKQFGAVSPNVASLLPGVTSVPALVDEIVSITRLLRGELASNGQYAPTNRLFEKFTAQMRAAITSAGYYHNGPDPFTRSKGQDRCAWCRTWILEPEAFQVASVQNVTVKPSIVEFLRFIHEFAYIEVAIFGPRLVVRSLLPVIGGMTLTKFQLDGRLRAVSSTPSGLSTGVTTSNGWSVRDYEGNFSDQTNSIEMIFYARKDDIPDIECNDQDHSNGQMEDCVTVCRVSLTFQLEEHVNVEEMSATIESRDSFIFISGTVAQASYNKTYSLDSQ